MKLCYEVCLHLAMKPDPLAWPDITQTEETEHEADYPVC